MKKIISFWILFLLAVASEAAPKPSRSFYITKHTFTGSQALTACANGYHMASLWEIFDVSNLRYDTTLGQTKDDSGSGPPIMDGWIRTGLDKSGTSGIVGFDNCLAWSTDKSTQEGTTVGLNFFWSSPPSTTIDPWVGLLFTCDFLKPVWCVQD
jgi:hypothetical protein